MIIVCFPLREYELTETISFLMVENFIGFVSFCIPQCEYHAEQVQVCPVDGESVTNLTRRAIL